MGFERWQMATENIEGYSDFNIGSNWYKNRKPGISAVIRCYGEERWIGPCIESSLPLYDEILITLTEVEGDRTEDIVKSFKSPKIRLLKYPFQMKPRKKKKKFISNSVHQFSYYTNWGLSKTCYSHVSARWDADHILRPEYSNNSFRNFVLSKSNIRVRSYNVVTSDFSSLSKTNPFQTYHVRFARVNPYLHFVGDSDFATYYGIPQWFKLFYWKNFPIQQLQSIINRSLMRDSKVTDPIFFHTKFLKMIEGQLEVDGKFCIGKDKYNNDCVTPGKKIDVSVPDFVFKKPDDYIS
jgi:hypothetical protein